MSEQAARECEDALQAREELDCLLDEKGAASRAGGMVRSLGCPSWFRVRDGGGYGWDLRLITASPTER